MNIAQVFCCVNIQVGEIGVENCRYEYPLFPSLIPVSVLLFIANFSLCKSLACFMHSELRAERWEQNSVREAFLYF